MSQRPPDPPLNAAEQLLALAKRLRGLREARGLTQEDLAERCGLSASFASLLERGERSPSYETLLLIASALGVSVSELFVEELESESSAGAYRLADFARERGLERLEVDRLLAVAEVLYPPPVESRGEGREGGVALCEEADCNKPVLARGLCAAHYHRARRVRS